MTASTKHIAFVVPELGKGGAERAVANLAPQLAAAGMKVSILTLRSGGAYEAAMSDGVRLVNLDLKGARALMRPLANYVAAERVDIVMSVLFHIDFYAVLSKLLYRWKAELAVCFQNTPSVVARESAATSDKLLLGVSRFFIRSADRFFAISKGVEQDARAFFGLGLKKIVIISNPIVDPARPAPVPQPLRPLFAPPVDSVIVASGRLTRQKDYPTMLRAFAELRNSRNAGLVVLGEGEDRAEVEDMRNELGLEPYVKFVGFQRDPLSWMAGADLFVLSSRWEGLANVVVEALSVGLPVVSTDCPYGPAEILEDGRLGRLVPIGDVAALARAMDEALGEGHDSKPGYQRALDFGVERIAKLYLSEFA